MPDLEEEKKKAREKSARMFELSFKQSTEGLTPEEERELDRLRQEIALLNQRNK